MKTIIKEMVRDDIKGNNKKPNLSEVKSIVKICKSTYERATGKG